MDDERAKRGGKITDAAIRQMIADGSPQSASQAAMASEGPGLFGFLIGVLGDGEIPRVVYADVCQRVASEIAQFDGRSTLRAWIYGIGCRELKDRRIRRRRNPPIRLLSMTPAIEMTLWAGLGRVIANIRGALSEEDRELFILRVDREFGWEELAFTRLGQQASPSEIAEEIRTLRERLEAIFARVERGARSYRILGPR